jgi:hypothetical protein
VKTTTLPTRLCDRTGRVVTCTPRVATRQSDDHTADESKSSLRHAMTDHAASLGIESRRRNPAAVIVADALARVGPFALIHGGAGVSGELSGGVAHGQGKVDRSLEELARADARCQFASIHRFRSPAEPGGEDLE